MNKLISVLLIAMLALLFLFSLAGCASEDGVNKVKSDADAVKAIGEVSTGVEDVSAELDSIDKQLS
jgi:outer membrane murein-binding lipoprotein Lpp